MQLQFEHAEFLLALGVVLPLAVLLCFISFRAREAARKRYGEGRLIDRQIARPGLRPFVISSAAWIVALTLMLFGAAGPFVAEQPDKVAAGSTQVIVVMDVSKSMAAEDYRDVMPGDRQGTQVVGPWGSRLEMVKVQMENIFQVVQGNPVGVITYTGEGFEQAPLTVDYEALRFVTKNFIRVGSAPGGGSDYARGLKEALESFKRDHNPNMKKVIVLFSDGGFTGDQGELNEVSSELVRQGVRLIIVGLGSDTPIPIPVYQGDQLTGYLKKDDQFVTTTIEEAPLMQLASATGGEYHHLKPGMAKLDIRWSKSMGGSRVEPQAKRLHPYFLGAALTVLFVLSLTGLARKRRTL